MMAWKAANNCALRVVDTTMGDVKAWVVELVECVGVGGSLEGREGREGREGGIGVREGEEGEGTKKRQAGPHPNHMHRLPTGHMYKACMQAWVLDSSLLVGHGRGLGFLPRQRSKQASLLFLFLAGSLTPSNPPKPQHTAHRRSRMPGGSAWGRKKPFLLRPTTIIITMLLLAAAARPTAATAAAGARTGRRATLTTTTTAAFLCTPGGSSLVAAFRRSGIPGAARSRGYVLLLLPFSLPPSLPPCVPVLTSTNPRSP